MRPTLCALQKKGKENNYEEKKKRRKNKVGRYSLHFGVSVCLPPVPLVCCS